MMLSAFFPIFKCCRNKINALFFQGCESLSYINIPSTVKDIGLCAINDAGIRSIEIPGKIMI